MSQTKAQLIQPVGVVTTKGVVVTGVVTATSFDGDVVGSATSIISGSNLNLGIVTATGGVSAFSGDFTGTATGIQTGSAIKAGSFTATSFTGDFTGTATSMAQGTGFKAGTVTSTPADTTYTVTVSGGKFYLDSIQTPTPSFYPRATYTFDQSDSSNATHILRLATAADAAGSTEYTFQVTTNGTPGSSGAWTKIVVSPSAPDTLYYYCTAHSGMGGSINITNHLQGGLTGAVTGDVKGNVTGDLTGDVTGDVTGNVTGNVTGDASGYAGGLGVNYNGGWTGAGTSQITAGVVTATTFYGDGSNLSGVSGGPVSQQEVTINSATTNIDLSNGNVIYATQSADTTINFTNVTNGDVWFIRTKDNNDTARTITWPSYVHWDGGSAPTLISESIAGDAQVFLFVTRNEGTTWYAKEVVNYNLDVPFNWWRWGLSDNGNQAGLLGQNSNVIYSSPVQIPGSWTGVAGRLSVKQDGTLWALGQDGHCQAGQNFVD